MKYVLVTLLDYTVILIIVITPELLRRFAYVITFQYEIAIAIDFSHKNANIVLNFYVDEES